MSHEQVGKIKEQADIARENIGKITDAINPAEGHHNHARDAASTVIDSLHTAVSGLQTFFSEIASAKSLSQDAITPAKTAQAAIQNIAGENTHLVRTSLNLYGRVGNFNDNVRVADTYITEADLTFLQDLEDRATKAQSYLKMVDDEPREIVHKASELYEASRRIVGNL